MSASALAVQALLVWFVVTRIMATVPRLRPLTAALWPVWVPLWLLMVGIPYGVRRLVASIPDGIRGGIRGLVADSAKLLRRN